LREGPGKNRLPLALAAFSLLAALVYGMLRQENLITCRACTPEMLGRLDLFFLAGVGILLAGSIIFAVTASWRRLSPITRQVALFAFVTIFLVNTAVSLLPGTRAFGHGWEQTASFLKVREWKDSWQPMFRAYNYLKKSDQTAPVYQKIFFEKKEKFQYPPTSLLITEVLDRIAPPGSYNNWRTYSPQGAARSFSWLAVVCLALCTGITFRESLARTRGQAAGNPAGPEPAALLLLAVALTLTYHPAVRSYVIGQLQTWIGAIFAVMYWSWFRGRKGLSGTLAALLCLMKPQYGLLFLWGGLRREWRFLVAGGVTLSVGIAVSIALFGLENHLDYLPVLSHIARHGETLHSNQSMNGLLNRLLHNGDALTWNFHEFAPFHPAVYAGTMASSAALLFAALRRPRPPEQTDTMADLSLMTLVCTMASPVAWTHHYNVLLPIFAWMIPVLWIRPVLGKFSLPIAGASYLLLATYLPVEKHLAAAPFGLNILQSYVYLAAGVIFIILYRLRPDHSTTPGLRAS